MNLLIALFDLICRPIGLIIKSSTEGDEHEVQSLFKIGPKN